MASEKSNSLTIELQARAHFSGNADVPVGSYVNADEDVGVPGKAPTPSYGNLFAHTGSRPDFVL